MPKRPTYHSPASPSQVKIPRDLGHTPAAPSPVPMPYPTNFLKEEHGQELQKSHGTGLDDHGQGLGIHGLGLQKPKGNAGQGKKH